MPFFVSVNFWFIICSDPALYFAPWPWEKEICASIIFEISWVCGRAKGSFSSEPSWGELKFFHPHAVSQGTHSILPLTCSTCLWWACRCLALLSSLFQKLGDVWGCNSSLIRVIFITFWLSGRFWRSKYKLQVVTSMCKQWGHAALLCKRRNPEGDPKLRTYTSPLFCGK